MTDNNGANQEMFKLAGDKYRELIENTPLCVKVFDKNGNLLFINKGGRMEHHVTEGQDVSKWDWMGTIKEKYRLETKKQFDKALAGESTEVEFEHTPEGSDHAWCHGYLSPIKDKEGNVESVLFYSVDVTESKNERGTGWSELLK
jgi:PAS domain S-box-containing protein